MFMQKRHTLQAIPQQTKKVSSLRCESELPVRQTRGLNLVSCVEGSIAKLNGFHATKQVADLAHQQTYKIW